MEDVLKNKAGLVILLTVPILFFGITFVTEDLQLGAEVGGGALVVGLTLILVSKLCQRYVKWDATPKRYILVFAASIGLIFALFFATELVVDTGVGLLEQIREKLSFEG